MKDKSRNHGRAAGQTSISASVPASIKARLLELARADKRNLSNFLTIHFEEYLASLANESEEAGNKKKASGTKKIKKAVEQIEKGEGNIHPAKLSQA